MVKLALGLAAAAALSPAYAAPLTPPPPAKTEGGKAGTDNRMPINRRFPDLDAYLAHLERQSHMDGAWYRQVRPGVYELQTGNLRLPDGGPRKRVFTRDELERKFGFSR